jgi:trehalose/maltose hydrolase-like predicted phosphorylase
VNITNTTWQIEQKGFDLDTAQAFEGLFTLGSGYLHTRASLEEHFSDSPQDSRELRRPANVTAEKFIPSPGRWGTFVPGVFGHHPLLLQEMINLPWFLELVPVVAGERLDATCSEISNFKRVLDMKTATLSRELTWRTLAGPVLCVHYERFISGSRPHLSVQRLRLETNSPVDVTVCAGIDANVTTNGFDHFESITMEPGTAGQGVLCEVCTNAGETVSMESQMSVSGGGDWRYTEEPRHSWCEAVFHVVPGRPLIVEKRTAVATSRESDRVAPKQILQQTNDKTWDELHAEHTRHWADEWRQSDVEIDGDAVSQLILRASIYHLLRAHVPNDSRVAIGAKGHAGEAYKGHFFWDTEVYLLPFYLYTDREKAKTLVQFRVHALSEAKNLAKDFGYRGARYPWESDADGRECCSGFQYSDHEIHVTADVVYGMAHYLAATGDIDNASEDFVRVAVETARYWLDRIDYRAGEDYPSILGVMGPDEYAPITNNNAYTNRLAVFNLALAARLGERGGATRQEIENFAKTAAALPIPRSTTNSELILQCESFEQLAEPRFDQFWTDRKGCYAARVSQERLYRSKNLKQADVLLLMTLFPNEFSDNEVRTAWECYVPLTTHDSSLSAGIHALIALRLGLEQEAWDFFMKSATIDLDTEHGGAAQGIHIAGCATNWQVAVFGFAGVKDAMQSDTLSIEPHLPAHWRSLAFPLVWQGVPLRIEISDCECRVENLGETKFDLRVWQKSCCLEPGQTVTLNL